MEPGIGNPRSRGYRTWGQLRGSVEPETLRRGVKTKKNPGLPIQFGIFYIEIINVLGVKELRS